MARADTNEAELRRRIESEREQLARTVERLRRDADPSRQLRERLPLLVGGSLAAGFVLGGGIGATARLLMRRSREGRERARIGRFAVAERR